MTSPFERFELMSVSCMTSLRYIVFLLCTSSGSATLTSALQIAAVERQPVEACSARASAILEISAVE